MEKVSEKLNHRRLAIEIVAIAVIVFGVILWRFIPWLSDQPLPISDNPDSEYKNLYSIVESYDFSKGPDEQLEKRMDRAIEGNSNSIQLYYNLKARLEYNYRLGNYDLAREDLEEAKSYIPNEKEYEYIVDIDEKLSK